MIEPPWKYLSECSETALQNFTVSQLNLAAESRKAIEAETKRMNEALVNAEVGRLLIEKREEILCMAHLRQEVLAFSGTSVLGTVLAPKEPVELRDQRKRLVKSEAMDGKGDRMIRSA